MSDKWSTGCEMKRTFNQSATEHWIEQMNRLREKGYDNLYVEADYHWAMANPESRRIIANTEGDVDVTECPDDESFVKELENLSDYMVRAGFISDSEMDKVNQLIKEKKQGL